ncbi:Long-chain acyl-CoA thioesterase FadM [Bdellovibrio bacteriovorus]|uniref:acyl-CoA thioesterase n=1 Tax=Bdellovibrio bacteriovorus TaxID=959 RepID=UPI00045BFD3E|nr:acyl-CoA thioesterase [Bdellovibrio bacteriovorus]AHZ83494.1 thioesterase [Bdellovibrio bacteriovorus]BEV69464.1 Long-chain acyl-CoA thioesterase FadM [Bdellovibrio bacteriovorus]
MSVLNNYKVTIKEHHVDSLGHMNNATYLALFEEARWEAITSRGYGFKDIQKIKQGPVILEVNLKFQREVLLRETITITLEMLGYKGKIAQMKQQMIKDDGSVASEAVFTFGLFDMKERKLIEPTPEWKRAIGMD